MTSFVELLHQAHIDSLAPHERVALAAAMFQWTRELLGRQVTAELGPMSEERLKWEVAKRMYGSEPAALALIEQKLADVSR